MDLATRVYNAAIADGIPGPLALLIVAQSKHESGNYTSPVFASCNNSFGYTTTGSNSCDGHGDYKLYNSIEDSTHDVTGWIYRRLNEGNFPALATITDPTQYATLLHDNGYYTDSIYNYAKGLISWYDANIQGVAAGGGLLLFIIIGGYFLLRRKRKGKNG